MLTNVVDNLIHPFLVNYARHEATGGQIVQAEVTTRWFKCDLCEDYYCALHDKHAFECKCPTLEEFIAQGVDPYLDNFMEEIIPIP